MGYKLRLKLGLNGLKPKIKVDVTWFKIRLKLSLNI